MVVSIPNKNVMLLDPRVLSLIGVETRNSDNGRTTPQRVNHYRYTGGEDLQKKAASNALKMIQAR